MTQQYLVGEFSSILGELQTLVSNGPAARAIARLRLEAEATPPWALAPLVGRAVALANRVAEEALTTGSAGPFIRALAICAELRVLGVCAGFLADTSPGGGTRPR
jgi:hypothetical protein